MHYCSTTPDKLKNKRNLVVRCLETQKEEIRVSRTLNKKHECKSRRQNFETLHFFIMSKLKNIAQD